MPRGPGPWLLLAVALTVVAVGAAASFLSTQLAFTLGVSPDDLAASLYGDREACQQPIDVPVAFQTLAFIAATDEPSGPPLAVEVRSFPGGRRLGGAVFDDPYSDEDVLSVRVGSIPAGERVSVCFRALGADIDKDDGAMIRGGPARAARSSAVFLNGRERPDDLALIFLRDRPRTLLSLVPDMLDRAALWRPGPASGALVAVILAAAAITVPLLLGRSLRRAGEAEDSVSGPSRTDRADAAAPTSPG